MRWEWIYLHRTLPWQCIVDSGITSSSNFLLRRIQKKRWRRILMNFLHKSLCRLGSFRKCCLPVATVVSGDQESTYSFRISNAACTFLAMQYVSLAAGGYHAPAYSLARALKRHRLYYCTRALHNITLKYPLLFTFHRHFIVTHSNIIHSLYTV